MHQEVRHQEQGCTDTGINKYYEEVIKDFEVYGLFNGQWVTFDKKTEFEAFLVRRL